ncbi:hypothetical protein PJF60_03680 [Streptococcus thermophilus]|nr:hypothetical protein [Streptococcus thermophilus]
MIKAYIDFWKRAFDFSGRSTRPDYWWVHLINVIISNYPCSRLCSHSFLQ